MGLKAIIGNTKAIAYAALCIAEALKREGGRRIYPAGIERSFEDCLSCHNGMVMMYYNDESGSTKIASVIFRG